MTSRDLSPGDRFKYPGLEGVFVRLDDSEGRWMVDGARAIAVSISGGWPLYADDMEIELCPPA